MKPLRSFGAQWKNCANRPDLPVNAKDIACSGAYCAVICSDRYRSQDIWRIKCKPHNQWSHEAFSPCLTCTESVLLTSISRIQILFHMLNIDETCHRFEFVVRTRFMSKFRLPSKISLLRVVKK